MLGDRTRGRGRVDVASLDSLKLHPDWCESFLTDGRVNVASEVCFMLDCEAWIKTLTAQRRKMLERMIAGDTTSELAQHFGVTAGRISQIRKELYDSWKQYQTEQPDDEPDQDQPSTQTRKRSRRKSPKS